MQDGAAVMIAEALDALGLFTGRNAFRPLVCACAGAGAELALLPA